MTKYISKKSGCRVSHYHEDPNCGRLKHDARKTTPSEIAYHELEPCWKCSDGTRNTHTEQDMRYQNVSIDPENDPLERMHE